ncbi:MAG: NADH-quinone oxidoreductase subunit NuoE [Tissierellia bacterium]|jgi:NADH:ubiquinone oxidoreductase subunit E|nr:NADH-quinone oxidoreductase subunit NuoE [Bacillota bacterium]NLL22758.1 NADH-quinone oxidoreductase subunit NuoE [Tissierellia bacterium]
MCKENDLFQPLKAFLANDQLTESDLIEILHFTQDHFGYIPDEAQFLIAKRLKIPTSRVYGVVTFYSYFTQVPKGENQISICLGTACYIKGAQSILNEFEKQLGISAGETTADRHFSINPTRCLGDCSKAPVVMVNEDVYSRVEPSDVSKILDIYRMESQEAK